jgi:biopolymer transport protein ExbD
MGLRKQHRDAEVSTDSLNDIMFFLLLFFLILSTMVSPNAIKVNLPNAKSKETIDNNAKPIHVAVSKDRKFFVNSLEVDFGSLEQEISKFSTQQAEPTVVMHLDKNLTIQDQVDIMTICNKLKCKTVLATTASNGK